MGYLTILSGIIKMILVVFILFAQLVAKSCESDIIFKRKVENTGDEDKSREGRINIIFPGTKWCGKGDIARGEEDLGLFKKTDACCRTHDNCPDFMNGHQTVHNLTNPNFFTRLSCDCDMKFYNCLKDAGGPVSRDIGVLYFNLLNTQCYKEDFPIKGCRKHSYFPRKKCLDYVLDESKEKVYQFFDLPRY